MDIKVVTFEKVKYGWNIQVDVKLTSDEASNCDISALKYVGDYETQLNDDVIAFKCLFDQGELKENETIEERLELIKIDIEKIAQSCFNS